MSSEQTGTAKRERTRASRSPESDGLLYAGAAFIALSHSERNKFFAKVDRLTTSWAAFKSTRLLDVKWCRPELAVRVKHLAGSKSLRHATVKV